MKHLKPIMLGGTGSDVGKSMLAAGLCRIFLQDGYRPAPFKAQNMALNSYVTPEGFEIGRAQAAQAAAAGIECCVEMNPVLLKPSGEMTSQVVVMGLPAGNSDAYSYFKNDGRVQLKNIARSAFDNLYRRYNPIVMEGAGSIAELNLVERDIVNMSMAQYADAKVILVADIDRGGIFASVYGSVMLQKKSDKDRIAGIIVNKFRGDIRLFEEGKEILERITGVPVLGIIPYLEEIYIEEEDSVSLKKKSTVATGENKVNVAVVALPHMSNFTDFDSLSFDPRVHLYFTSEPSELEKAEVIILPGTKATISDLMALRERGCDSIIQDAVRRGMTVFGICGGYQMMGKSVSDPEGIEGSKTDCPGFDLLPVETVLTQRKKLSRCNFKLYGSDNINKGYEIHMGVTERDKKKSLPFATKENGAEDGCMLNERVIGTYLHGCLDNSEIIEMLISPYIEKRGLRLKNPIDHDKFMDLQYNKLADVMRKHLDMEKIYKIMETE